MKKKIMALVSVVVFASTGVLAVTQVTDVGPKTPPHVFEILAGGDSTYHSHDFDYNGDGKLDINQITAIGYRNGGATTDTLWIHVDKSGSASGLFKMIVPPSAIDSFSQRGRMFPDIRASVDSTVIRYHAITEAAYLYVWGE